MDLPATGHDPVLMNEVLGSLEPKEGMTLVDCTVGRGGHSLALGRLLGKSGTLIGMDVDPRNLEFARERLKDGGCNVRLFHANFAEIKEVLEAAKVAKVDGILADLGVSTNQLFDEAYGLSFSGTMPLEMRLDPRLPHSAEDFLRTAREEDLANVLFNLAQERYSRRIARKIVEERRISPIKTTERLADIVRSAIPRRGGAPERIDPATRTFLALRMHVNREIKNLEVLLANGWHLLKPGARMAVISFHSTEDRLVKQAFRSAEQAGLVRVLTKKPLVPTESETAQNPRSRSAKLRAAERI